MDIKEALTFEGLKYFYQRYIKPLGNAARCSVVNNSTTTTANTVLDGRMGKTLGDRITKISTDLDIKAGQWTPVAKNNIQIISYSNCNYYKIGKLVFIQAWIKCKGLKIGGDNSQNIITGLPYVAVSGDTLSVNYTNLKSRSDYNITHYDFRTEKDSKDVKCVYWTDDRSWDADSGLSTTEGQLMFSGVYMTK